MTQKVLLLHGWGGSDYPHWQSWLAGEIAKEYGCLYFLRFSDVDRPKLSTWTQELERALQEFQPDIVICHSLANTLWFHLCNENKIIKEVEKLYLVAAPSLDSNIQELQEFFPLSVPSKLYAKEALLISSTNDPYMSLENAKKLQEDLKIPMKILQDAGHINNESGFGEWRWMLKELKKSSQTL